ncbi:HET-domain-containing protein [Pseudovirgaria hyperparasitica]|uniref:HET-domain-containing protein n=1 Tax=Pseudovirgaria hyperparasitica TaxID=470096 RepID=A0A6A6W0L3_9PEZI|nr:HET-domain-containing protein [Pseudovirgaria hyperparasitica]KAF2755470.1 HET-domain-containing protein [Pseudovirgaria hyperparasitica]
MRLLRVKDWLFEDGTPDRKYAILSHTWIQEASEEVYYPDIRDIALRSDEENALLKGRRGWSKVSNTVAQAVRDGLEYVWIDTCCIDQKNPTELTTSINSMFEWYAKATVCYVYLEDVFKTATPSQIDFSKARWSTRGWTLQELIAPKSVIFFDATWDLLSTRADSACDLSRVTSIDEEVLRDGPNNLSAYSVAKRMSWAAGRCTSRPEDRAYSLFGIFGITMPTHYGEGGKNAFVRLQEEIIKYSDDQSLKWYSFTPGSIARPL